MQMVCEKAKECNVACDHNECHDYAGQHCNWECFDGGGVKGAKCVEALTLDLQAATAYIKLAEVTHGDEQLANLKGAYDLIGKEINLLVDKPLKGGHQDAREGTGATQDGSTTVGDT